MNTVSSPYFDPDFDSLSERVYGPPCRVTVDNDTLKDCTVLKIDSLNRKGLLLELIQLITDMNLTILKGYISFDAGWFMDVFHVKDENGKKITEQKVINYIQKGVCTSRESRSSRVLRAEPPSEPTAIEMTGKDRPGLFSEISAALADLQVNIIEAHAWSHNARLACVAHISDQTDNRIDDNRLANIEDHLTTVLRATSTNENTGEECIKDQEVKKTAGGLLLEGEGTTTDVERRLHQLMLSVRDFDLPPSPPAAAWGSTRSKSLPTMRTSAELMSDSDEEEKKNISVSIESCDEKGYSIVMVHSKDRRRLMFDTVCTLTDLQYAIFHASVDSREGHAFQEYFIRHIDGYAFNTESEKERLRKCLEAAIERRVSEGVRLELCAKNRVGLLSDITRVLRENGLAVERADVAARGEKAVNAFYVRDISGNSIDMDLVKSMTSEMGSIEQIALQNESSLVRSNSSSGPSTGRTRFAFGELLKSGIGRFSPNFISIK